MNTPKSNPLTERELEKWFVCQLQKLNCCVRKLTYINRNGAPDRLVITPDGVVWFVELKTERGRLSAVQTCEQNLLRKARANVITLKGKQEAELWLDTLARAH